VVPSKIGFSWLDVKLGLRMLWKHPGLTLVSVFALAVGIPVGMVPIHVVKAEAPPPLDESDRIQVLRNSDVTRPVVRPTGVYDFVQWREELTSFEILGAAFDGVYNVISEDGRAAPVEGAEVTASTFDILRVPPFLGRPLIAADEVIGAPAVVVIGHDLWESRFGSDPDVVGRTIRVGGVQRTVVGVMPKEFLYPLLDHIWVPLQVDALAEEQREERMLRVFGRLADGISPEQAQAELTTLGARMAADRPETHARLRPEVVPFTIGINRVPKGGLRALPEFYLFQTFALLMLLFPSINIGMLVLVRTATRSNELAVRTALGASRMRIVLQLFMESLVLAVLAAGVGLLISGWAASRIGASNGIVTGWTLETALWALALAVFSATVVGVIPALKVTGRNIQASLRRATATAGRSAIRFGALSSALIVVDVALAVAILGVSVGIWGENRRSGMGIQADQYLSAELRIPRVDAEADAPAMGQSESARLAATQEALVRRLAAEPGVGGVAVANLLPGMDHPNRWVEVESGVPRQKVRIARVDIGFFDALEQPILSGRGFDSGDLGENRSAVIVNANFVDQVLGGRNPLGRRIRRWSRTEDNGPWYEIVGVVGHLGMFANDAERDAGVYYPLAPGEIYPVPFAIRVGDDPGSFTPRLRTLAAEADPTAIIWAPVALDEVFNFQVTIERLVRSYAIVLIGILLTIATLAIYALMSFTVAQRTKEIGIRIALGAGWRSIVGAIARRAMVQLGVGALVGMTIAAFLLHVLTTQLGQNSMGSPVLVASLGTVFAVGLIGSVACIAPTLRALRIAPTEALSEEA
jgi:predicted permease